jgi:meromycolic acid enoyl-[acyl-carrier-protein] reductase
MLAGKRLLITGVLTKGSIAYAVAERAQQEGAEIVLTGFGRTRRMTERAAKRLPEPPDVLELDVNNPDDLSAVQADLRERWGQIDGVLHAIAFAPGDALGGKFMSAPAESAELAFRTSAYSFKALAEALLPLARPGASFVAMDFDASVA